MLEVKLPGVRAALVDPGSTTSQPFYRFFQNLQKGLLTLSKQVDGIANQPSDITAIVRGANSVQTQGTLQNGFVQITLVNDVDTAPPLSFYGSIAEDDRGWHLFSPNFQAGADGSGNELLDLSNTGVTAGVFGDTYHVPQITLDVKGRVTQAVSVGIGETTATALTALSYPNVVALDGMGNAYYPNLGVPADLSRIVGVTTHAAAAGAPIHITTFRDFTETSWNWSPGRIYCSQTGGALTQTPAAGAIVEVARVLTPTSIRVGIQPAILRN